MRKAAVIGTASLLLFVILAASLEAMPAFARKYSMTCKTCHSPFPKLKSYGDEFAGNGFVIKDKDTPRYFTDTGDGLLPLLREIPIAFRLEGFLTFNNSNTSRADFEAPRILKIMSGGELAKNVAYYFYFFFSENGVVAGIEDAFLMFNDLFGTDLDLYVGQFQVSDPLFKREIRLPYEDYAIYTARPGSSRIGLTYDRGIMLTYGLPTGTDFTLEILNGNGIGEGSPFDDDKYKTGMLRVSQDVGEVVRVGGFGYYGKENPDEIVNRTWMLGADATLSVAPFELNLQYVERRDDNPYFEVLLPSNEIRTRGAFAELIFRPRGDDSRWYGAGLFNWVDSDDAVLRYTAATLHCGYLLRRNMRLVAEATYVFRGMDGKHVRPGIGLIMAF